MGRTGGRGYHEIREYYENLIRTGRLGPGEMLPTEKELAKTHQVTRTTIRRAFAGLENKGLVSRQQGRGSFVAGAADVQSRESSHVVIAVPRTMAQAPPDGFYTEEIRYHDGMYQFLEAFMAALGNVGRPCRVFYYPEDDRWTDRLIAVARANGDLGIIIYDVNLDPVVERLAASGIPTVFVDSFTFGRLVDIVKLDGVEASRHATQHLLQTTPGPLAYVGSSASRTAGSPHKERLDGFLLAHSRAGREVPEDYIVLASVKPSSGRRAADSLLRLPAPPTGYVCSDDDLAAGVMATLRERGISVPGQVSVFGFGDSLYSRTTPPNLSTIAMDRRTMGLKAVELLHERLADPKAPPKVVSVPAQVLFRQTTIVAAPAGLPEPPAK